MKSVTFLIVGQGLAGTALALHLLESNQSFLVADVYRENTSSKVAAGLVNPITGRRFARTWMADALLPYSEQFYREKEQLFGASFYHEMPIYRYFGSVDDENTWMGRSADPAIFPYAGEVVQAHTEGMKNDFGVVNIKKGGFLDTRAYLSAAKTFLEEKNLLINQQVSISADGRIAGLPDDMQAEHIIFCEGHHVTQNPCFKWLPFTFAKGELMTVKLEGVSQEVIHNKNGFILPLGNHIHRIGATYRWNEMNEDISERSRDELTEKMAHFTDIPFQIIKQEASIRPTVKDRRPLIGTHPTHKHLHIFNGFGSKGVSLTPYFAKHFTEVLAGNHALIEEVDIARFENLFRNASPQD